MNSRDWQGWADVFRAGAASYASDGLPRTTGTREAQRALLAQAQACEGIARQRADQEQAARTQEARGGLS